MLRSNIFGGLFIMKKDDGGEWEYLSKYSHKKENHYFRWSKDQVNYFPDTSIKEERAWKAFAAVREQYSQSRIILYAIIRGEIVRVKYYNPSAETKTVSWYSPSDFYAYLPRQIYY